MTISDKTLRRMAAELRMTDAQRAKRFHAVVRNYGGYRQLSLSLTRLLADARHWCDRHGQGYADADASAHAHYLLD